jgi:hypothetical protein
MLVAVKCIIIEKRTVLYSTGFFPMSKPKRQERQEVWAEPPKKAIFSCHHQVCKVEWPTMQITIT